MRTLYLILQEDCDGEGATPFTALSPSPEWALSTVRAHLQQLNEGADPEEGYEPYPIPDAWGYIQSDEAIATFKREFRNAEWAIAMDEFVFTLHKVEAPE